MEIALRAKEFQSIIADLGGRNRSYWSKTEEEVFVLVDNFYTRSQSYKGMPLLIVPSFDDSENQWLSPWDTVLAGGKNKNLKNESIVLRDMFQGFIKKDRVLFHLSLKSFAKSVKLRLAMSHQKVYKKIGYELIYNKLNFLFWAKVFYLFTFIVFLLAMVIPFKFLYSLANASLLLAIVLQVCTFVVRAFILGRPPVTNLYETFIFVGFIGAIIGWCVERYNKEWLGLIIASISGFTFLMIGSRYAVEGDTLKVLVAVLNSNFWLSTHVITINMGYAAVCVSGIVGHVYVLQAIFKKGNKKILEKTYKVLMGTLGAGLTLSFLGTNLGGVWADQSWGRFWGWDPKENGALLIILWCALLFHARLANMIKPLGLAIGTIFGIIVVIWAWLGVNLLNVGLHSYGFTEGIARNVLIYVFLQIMFIVISYPIARKNIV